MSSYSELFDIDPHLVHLNHAGVAPWPRDVVQAVTRFACENARWGSQHHDMWLRHEEELRELARKLIDAESKDEIALLKNTSEGLSMIATGLDWKTGDNMVLVREEFPSNRLPWEAAAQRHEIEIRWVSLYESDDPEQALLDRIDSRTRILAVSSVQYARGLKIDLSRLGAALRDTPTLFCVDAIQSLGAHSLSVRKSHIDCLAADAHKWMLGPEGIALFWVHPKHYGNIVPSQYGWHMTERPGHYEAQSWSPATSAQRFECGSPNTTGIYALHASLSLLHGIGMRTIEDCIEERIEQLDQALQALGLEILTPTGPERRAGILTFAHPDQDNLHIHAQLLKQGVLCAARGGGIRFSPHFYTPASALQTALEKLQDILD